MWAQLFLYQIKNSGCPKFLVKTVVITCVHCLDQWLWLCQETVTPSHKFNSHIVSTTKLISLYLFLDGQVSRIRIFLNREREYIFVKVSILHTFTNLISNQFYVIWIRTFWTSWTFVITLSLEVLFVYPWLLLLPLSHACCLHSLYFLQLYWLLFLFIVDFFYEPKKL